MDGSQRYMYVNACKMWANTPAPWILSVNKRFISMILSYQPCFRADYLRFPTLTHQFRTFFSSLWPKPTSTNLPKMHKTYIRSIPLSSPSHIIPFSPFPTSIRLNKEGNQWWMKLIIKPWRFESQVFQRSFLKRASWKYTSSATTRQVQRKLNMWFLHIEVFCHFLLRFAIFLGHVYI